MRKKNRYIDKNVVSIICIEWHRDVRRDVHLLIFLCALPWFVSLSTWLFSPPCLWQAVHEDGISSFTSLSLPVKTIFVFGFMHGFLLVFLLTTPVILHVPFYCRQDFMLIVSQSIGSNATKDKPTEKHLFTMVTSRVIVCEAHRHRHTHSLSLSLSCAFTLLLSLSHHSFQSQRLKLAVHVDLHSWGSPVLFCRSGSWPFSSPATSTAPINKQKATPHHLSALVLLVAQPVNLKSKTLRSMSTPAVGRPSKAPTLLWSPPR